MKKILYLFICMLTFFMLGSNVCAFEMQSEILMAFDSSIITNTIDTSDGGKITSGFLLEYPENATGNQIAEDVCYIFKYNDDFELEWEYKFSSGYQVAKIIELSNGNFVALLGNFEDSKMLFFSSKGTLINEVEIDSMMFIIFEFQKESLIVFGYGMCTFSLDGELDQCFGTEGILYFNGYISEEEYIFVGKDFSTGNGVVSKFNEFGNLEWRYLYEAKDDGIFLDVGLDSKGNVLVGGGVTIGSLLVPIALKLDPDGNLLKDQIFHGYDMSHIFTTIELQNEHLNVEIQLLDVCVDFALFSDEVYLFTVNAYNQAYWGMTDSDFNLLDFDYSGGDIFSITEVDEKDGVIYVYINCFADDFSANGTQSYFDESVSTAYGKLYLVYDMEKSEESETYDIEVIDNIGIITLNPKEGYELDNIIIKDKNGNIIPYEEKDGKYYVDLKDDYIVDVKYKEKSEDSSKTDNIDNPLTMDFSTKLIISLIILLSLLFISSKLSIKRYNN